VCTASKPYRVLFLCSSRHCAEQYAVRTVLVLPLCAPKGLTCHSAAGLLIGLFMGWQTEWFNLLSFDSITITPARLDFIANVGWSWSLSMRDFASLTFSYCIGVVTASGPVLSHWQATKCLNKVNAAKFLFHDHQLLKKCAHYLCCDEQFVNMLLVIFVSYCLMVVLGFQCGKPESLFGQFKCNTLKKV